MKKLAVLMPAFNAEQFVSEAIESILSQTYRTFDFIILDDASTDTTASIIEKYANQDERIYFLQNKHNEGIIESRNKLFDISHNRYEYIALMDADDIALPKRLEKELNYLTTNPHIGIVSSDMEIFPSKYIAKLSKDNIAAKETMIFRNIICNPCAMFRASIMYKHNIRYDPSVRGASDYKFWLDILRFSDLYILPEVLTLYRRHAGQESTCNEKRQKSNHIKIVHSTLQHLDQSITKQQVEKILFYTFLSPEEKMEIFKKYCTFLELNQKKRIFDTKKFKFYIQTRSIELFEFESLSCFFNIFKIVPFKDILSSKFLITKISKTIIFKKSLIKKGPSFATNRLIQKIKKLNCSHFSVYGLGAIAESFLHTLEVNYKGKYTIESLFDIKATKNSYTYKGYTVLGPQEIKNLSTKIVVITSRTFKKEILESFKIILKEKYKSFTFITL